MSTNKQIEELNKAIRERENIITAKNKQLNETKSIKTFTQRFKAQEGLRASIKGEEKVLLDLRNRLAGLSKTVTTTTGQNTGGRVETPEGDKFVKNLQNQVLTPQQQAYEQKTAQFMQAFDNYRSTVQGYATQFETLRQQTSVEQQQIYNQFKNLLAQQEQQVVGLQQQSEVYRLQQTSAADSLSKQYNMARESLSKQQEGAELETRTMASDAAIKANRDVFRGIARRQYAQKFRR